MNGVQSGEFTTLPDGLYAVVQPRWVAGFVVERHHVTLCRGTWILACSSLLRGALGASRGCTPPRGPPSGGGRSRSLPRPPPWVLSVAVLDTPPDTRRGVVRPGLA